MIADDAAAIRAAMKKLAQAKVQAQAEAERRAAEDAKPVKPQPSRPLFSDSYPPFRGFFVSEGGFCQPNADPRSTPPRSSRKP